MENKAEKKLTKEYFETSGCEELIAKSPERELIRYNGIFYSEASAASANGDKERERLFRLLGDITGMAMKSDDIEHPFHAMFAMEGKRSAMPEDFTTDELAYCEEIISSIKDLEMRVRIADILWIRRRNYKFAEMAIDGYIELSNRCFDAKNWVNPLHFAERAFNLALTLGGGNQKFQDTLAFIESTLVKLDGEDPLYFSEKLMNILCARRLGEPQKYSKLSEKLASTAEAQNDFSRARTYWERKAKWDEIAEDEDGRKRSLEKVAESFIKEAQARVEGGQKNHMVASSFLQNAIEVYRRIGGMKEKVDEIHKLMMEYQKLSLDELSPISAPIDVTECAKQAIDSVKGKSFRDAVLELAGSVRIERYSELKRRVEDNFKNYPMQYLFHSSLLNEKGKVVGKKKSILGDEENDAEAALYSHAISESQYGYHISVIGTIEPIRKQIWRDHHLANLDLAPIVWYNPLVPEGREALYLKGLLAGFESDFVTSTHILVPQFENSLRYLYEKNNLIASSVDSEGIQKEYDLNVLLYKEETKKILGEDLTFHLQSLLVAEGGANIRNRMAHGLYDYNSFYGTQMVFFWGLILKLLCWPFHREISNYEENGVKA